jgi:hypothetical protein
MQGFCIAITAVFFPRIVFGSRLEKVKLDGFLSFEVNVCLLVFGFLAATDQDHQHS